MGNNNFLGINSIQLIEILQIWIIFFSLNLISSKEINILKLTKHPFLSFFPNAVHMATVTDILPIGDEVELQDNSSWTGCCCMLGSSSRKIILQAKKEGMCY